MYSFAAALQTSFLFYSPHSLLSCTFLSRCYLISVLRYKPCGWFVSPRNVPASLRLESQGTRKRRLGLTALWLSWRELWLSFLSFSFQKPRHSGGRDVDGALPCCCSRPSCLRRSQPSCKRGEVPSVPRPALALCWEGAGTGWGLPPCFLILLSSLPISRAGQVLLGVLLSCWLCAGVLPRGPAGRHV